MKKTTSDALQAAYEAIARQGASCCGPDTGCCGDGRATALAQALGYTPSDLASLPEGANLGLSCGHPTALADLKPGETVVDLGCGAGMDVFVAAAQVGPTGHVHGVDRVEAMVTRARANTRAFQERTGLDNVTFHHAPIESLPLPDATMDVVLSNCVLNLSHDQPRVWREIARVLKPGGRAVIADMVLLRPLPEALRSHVEAWVGCIAGASLLDDVEAMARAAGLVDLRRVSKSEALDLLLAPEAPLTQLVRSNLPDGVGLSDLVASMTFVARKPLSTEQP